MMMSQDMLTVPICIGTLGTRLPLRALGAIAAVKPWGHGSAKFGEDTIELVDSQKMLLPLPNEHRTIMVKDNSTRIVYMTVTSSSGLHVSLLVKVPVSLWDSSRLGLVPGEMGFDPCDTGKFMQLCHDTAPKITMLKTRGVSPLESALQGITNISAICHNVQTTK